MKTRMGFIAAAGLALSTAALAAQTLTYVDLVNRLTDLEALSTLPQPGEPCALWSSYDRASQYFAEAGKYVKWDANGAGSGVLRKEGGLSVLAGWKAPAGAGGTRQAVRTL
jgi:hypothetical protein